MRGAAHRSVPEEGGREFRMLGLREFAGDCFPRPARRRGREEIEKRTFAARDRGEISVAFGVASQ